MQAFIILLVTTFFFFSVKSSKLNIIRDAETENFLKEVSYILIRDNNLELNNLNFFNFFKINTTNIRIVRKYFNNFNI